MSLGPGASSILQMLGPSLGQVGQQTAQRQAQLRGLAAQPTPGRQILGLPGTAMQQPAMPATPDLVKIFELIQQLQGKPAATEPSDFI